MNMRLKDLIKYRFLLQELVSNEIKIKYRRSVLGVLWSVLQPLMMMIILTVVFSAIFKSNIKNFAVYVLTGRIIWDLFQLTTTLALNSIVTNAGLIKKVYVPKYIFPISKGLTALVNTGFSLVALVLVIIFTGVKINFSILLLPIPLLSLFLFAVGIGLIMSAYTVFFRDLAYLYELVLTVWMYLTPIFYPLSIIPEKYSVFIKLNPIIYYLEMFRDIVMYGKIPALSSFLICLLIGIASLITGFYLFNKKQDKFILHI